MFALGAACLTISATEEQSMIHSPMCQWISGKDVDEAVGELLVEIVTPVAIEATLAVQQELQARLHEVERLRKEQVERARYEADLAQRRYMRVDPDNRLVANTLEADWNQKLRALQEAQQEYERQRQKDSMTVDEELRRRLHTLATDFPRLWRDPNTPDRERKRLAHLLLQDVTLIKLFLEEQPGHSSCHIHVE